MFKLCNESSFLDTALNDHLDSEMKLLNHDLAVNNEERIEIVYEEDCCKYKEELMKAFRGMVDPFAVEFVGDVFDYEQNPAEPTNPTKTLTINPFKPIWD